MTYEEAKNLKFFKEYCSCGGFAHSMNGRNPARPHMSWCPQMEEYNEWYDALHESFPKAAICQNECAEELLGGKKCLKSCAMGEC